MIKMAKPKLNKLIDIMYLRLSKKNMVTPQIRVLYTEIKENYKDILLDELDGVCMEENKREKVIQNA